MSSCRRSPETGSPTNAGIDLGCSERRRSRRGRSLARFCCSTLCLGVDRYTGRTSDPELFDEPDPMDAAQLIVPKTKQTTQPTSAIGVAPAPQVQFMFCSECLCNPTRRRYSGRSRHPACQRDATPLALVLGADTLLFLSPKTVCRS